MANAQNRGPWSNYGSLHGGPRTPRLETRPVEIVGQEINERYVVTRQSRDYVAERANRRHDLITRADVARINHDLLRHKIGQRQAITDLEALGLDKALASDIIARLQARNPAAVLLP